MELFHSFFFIRYWSALYNIATGFTCTSLGSIVINERLTWPGNRKIPRDLVKWCTKPQKRGLMEHVDAFLPFCGATGRVGWN